MAEYRRLYKFYSARWALDAVERERLKVSTIQELNDPFEISPFAGNNSAQRRALETTRQELFKGKGLISFSKCWSNPVLWSHYAENHRGVALGFDVRHRYCLDVYYTPDRRPITEFIRSDGSVDPRAGTAIAATKFSHWSYEDETPLLLNLDGLRSPSSGLHFKDFDEDLVLREIILGPLYASRGERSWHDDLTSRGVEIITSRLAFRKFAVCKQCARTRQKTI